MKSWLAQGSSGRRVTLLPGTTFFHINGAQVLTSNQTQYVLKYSLDFVFLFVRSLDDSLV